MAPIGCRRLEEVVVLVAKPIENIYQLWADWFFESTQEKKRVFHVWNLGWEWKPIMKWWVSSDFYEEGKAKAVVTSHEIYSLEIPLGDRLVKFVDDNCHYHTSVKQATEELLKLPQYDRIMKAAGLHGKEKKEVEQLHEIWYLLGGEARKTYLHYAAVDAFCQALCCEHLFDTGRFVTPNAFEGKLHKVIDCYDCGLSASSAGAREAKALCLYQCHYKDVPEMNGEVLRLSKDATPQAQDKAIKTIYRRLDDLWALHFGTPDRSTRIVVEKNLRGGEVWGVPGVHQGCFYHYDYKSSYP